jgi:predicted SnoaL-like aldol condensation-catalyzing enzyme
MKKQHVIDLLKSIETGDPKPVDVINSAKYIQHNLSAADGLAGLQALLQQLPKGSAKVNTVRAFEDGPHVFTHTEYDFFGPKIGFDIFRFEGNHIVEHWDNLQTTAGPNPSGHTMTDGPTNAKDPEGTDSNKHLAQQFVEDILINKKMDNMDRYFHGDNYIQHNSMIPDRVSGLKTALADWAKQGITLEYKAIHKVLGEGNFVLVVGEGELAGKPTAFYDLFRIENCKIAEHWDVIEQIPPREDWKNDNGKF